MKKIIYVLTDIFMRRDFHRFGVEYLMGKEYPTEIWRITTSKSINFSGSAPNYYGENYHEYIFDEFKRMIEIYKDSIYILFNPSFFWEVNFEVVQKGVKYVVWSGMAGCFQIKYTGIIEKIKYGCERGVFIAAKQMYDSFLHRQKRKKYIKAQEKNNPLRIITSTHTVAPVYMSEKELYMDTIYTHAMDYDRYIEENRKGGTTGKKYIVFADSGYASFDIDIALGRHKGIAKPKKYARQIKSLLFKLSIKYELPIVILGHPHTQYTKSDFDGMEIVFNRTSEFAREAAIFVLTASLAVNFAALYNLPTLEVVNLDFKHNPIYYPNTYDHVKYFSEVVIGCGFLDMDDEKAMDHPWDYVKRMDSEKRKKYIHDYLIDNDTTEKCSYEYLEEAIRPVFYGE